MPISSKWFYFSYFPVHALSLSHSLDHLCFLSLLRAPERHMDISPLESSMQLYEQLVEKLQTYYKYKILSMLLNHCFASRLFLQLIIICQVLAFIFLTFCRTYHFIYDRFVYLYLIITA